MSDYLAALKLQMSEIDIELKDINSELTQKENEVNKNIKALKRIQNKDGSLKSELEEITMRKEQTVKLQKDIMQNIRTQNGGKNPIVTEKPKILCGKRKKITQKDSIINIENMKKSSKLVEIVVRDVEKEKIRKKPQILPLKEKKSQNLSFKEKIEKCAEIFGIEKFRKEQIQAFEAAKDGKDCLILMASGSGKSVCYQVPALIFGGLTVVISPLISLMQDQILQMQKIGVESRMLSSAIDADEKKDIFSDIEAENGILRLLYVTPEMFVKSKRLISKLKVCYEMKRFRRLVVDEAHCCSQWGYDFRTDYFKLKGVREKFPETPIMALTATATEKTRKDVVNLFEMNNLVEIVSSFNRPNIFYEVRFKPLINSVAVEMVKMFIKGRFKNLTGIVYCVTRKECEETSSELRKFGILSSPYHAGLSDEERSDTYKDWIEERFLVVVATTAFGMGINKPNVRFVIHFSLPQSIESYYQESGRAGRDGEPAHSLVLYRPNDISKVGSVTKKLCGLLKVAGLCQSLECRRKAFFDYFYLEKKSLVLEKCNSTCDNCLNKNKRKKIEENEQNKEKTIDLTPKKAEKLSIKCSENTKKLLKPKNKEFEFRKIVKIETTKYRNNLISLLKALNMKKNATFRELINAWRGNGKKKLDKKALESIKFVSRKELGNELAELVVMSLILRGDLSLVLRHNAFSSNVYVSKGLKAFDSSEQLFLEISSWLLPSLSY